MSEVIELDSDEDVRALPGAKDTLVEIDGNGEVQVTFNAALCEHCDRDSSISPVRKLRACGHYAHVIGCCHRLDASRTTTTTQSGSKRQRVSTSPTATGLADLKVTQLSCPVCHCEVDWRDQATDLDRAAYLESTALSAEDLALRNALDQLLSKWSSLAGTKQQQNGRKPRASPVKSKAAKKNIAAATAARAGAIKAGAVKAGTGYGGTAQDQLSMRAVEASRQRQAAEDDAMTVAFAGFNAALMERRRTAWRAATERMLRTRLHSTSLPALLKGYVRNGPSDVVSRRRLYLEILSLVNFLSDEAFLIPLLISNDEFDEQETKSSSKQDENVAEEIDRSVLACLAALSEGLKQLDLDAGVQELKALVDKATANTVSNASGHPLLRGRIAEKIVEVVKSGRAARKRKQGEAKRVAMEANASPEEMEKAYKAAMAPMQFRAIALLDLCAQNLASHTHVRVDRSNGPATVMIGHESRGYAGANDATRMSRIRKEIASLRSSMPLEWSSSVFAAIDEARPDVIQVLIVGPEGTPYQNGLFLFDVLLGPTFPAQPPQVKLQTTGGGRVRFNPNLYADGKVCLSLLGTWSGPGWDPKTSTLLQVLISIQSLILVPDPYFNEPGFESSMGTPPGMLASSSYNANIRFHTMRVAIAQMIRSPPYAFKEIVKTHFEMKRREILKQLEVWRDDFAKFQQQVASTRFGSVLFQPFDSAGAASVPAFATVITDVQAALSSTLDATKAAAPNATIDLLLDENTPGPVGSSASLPKSQTAIETGDVVELLDSGDDDEGTDDEADLHYLHDDERDGEDDEIGSDESSEGQYLGDFGYFGGLGMFGGSDDEDGY